MTKSHVIPEVVVPQTDRNPNIVPLTSTCTENRTLIKKQNAQHPQHSSEESTPVDKNFFTTAIDGIVVEDLSFLLHIPSKFYQSWFFGVAYGRLLHSLWRI